MSVANLTLAFCRRHFNLGSWNVHYCSVISGILKKIDLAFALLMTMAFYVASEIEPFCRKPKISFLVRGSGSQEFCCVSEVCHVGTKFRNRDID